jgi:hypothetical protein
MTTPPTSTAAAGWLNAPVAGLPVMRPPTQASMTALPNRPAQNKAATAKGTTAMPMTVTQRISNEYRREQHGDEGRQHSVPRRGLEGLNTLADGRPKQQRHADIKRQEAQRQPPGPTEAGYQGQRAEVEQAVMYPNLQPGDVAHFAAQNAVDAAVNDGCRIAPNRSEKGYHVTADFRVRAQLDAAPDGDGVALDPAIHVGVAQDRHRIAADGSRGAGITEHGDHLSRIALIGRRADDGHHGPRRLSARQQGIVADADNIVSMPRMPIVRILKLRIVVPFHPYVAVSDFRRLDPLKSRGLCQRGRQRQRAAAARRSNPAAFSWSSNYLAWVWRKIQRAVRSDTQSE